MNDDLTIPDFLDRKKNPVEPCSIQERRAWLASLNPAHAGVARFTREVVELAKGKPVAAQTTAEWLAALTPGEEDELVEIKAMVKTSLEHAKRMAHDWVTRTGIDRKAAARRRAALKTVKGLRRRT